MIATLTAKGQVTLPLEVRKQLRLKPGMKFQVLVAGDGKMELVPVKIHVESLKGMAPKPSVPLSLEDMNHAIAEGACS